MAELLLEIEKFFDLDLLLKKKYTIIAERTKAFLDMGKLCPSALFLCQKLENIIYVVTYLGKITVESCEIQGISLSFAEKVTNKWYFWELLSFGI